MKVFLTKLRCVDKHNSGLFMWQIMIFQPNYVKITNYKVCIAKQCKRCIVIESAIEKWSFLKVKIVNTNMFIIRIKFKNESQLRSIVR